MARRSRLVDRRGQAGQATVELALLLPVLVVVLVIVVQVGVVARDRVVLVHVTRAVARGVAVRPDRVGSRQVLEQAVGEPGRYTVVLGGDLRPGGLATVTVATRPTMLPLLRSVVPGPELRERMVVRVEGPP